MSIYRTTYGSLPMGEYGEEGSPGVAFLPYYEGVIEALGIDGNCVFHAPLDEETGSQAADVSGNGNHGTYTGGPILGEDPSGLGGAVYSVGLNGTTAYIALPFGASIDPATTSFVVSVRFKASAAADQIWGIGSGSTDYISAYTDASNVIVRGYDGTNFITTTCTGGVDGDWHTLVVLWDHNDKSITAWLDGTQHGPNANASYSAGTPTEFGIGDGPRPIGTLLGGVEIPTVYNTALPPFICSGLSAESPVADIVDVLGMIEAEGYGANVVGYYRCTETSSPLTDYSDAGNNLTISGTPTYDTGPLGDKSWGGITFGGSQYGTVAGAPVDLSTDSFTGVIRFDMTATNDGLMGLSGGTYDSLGLLVRSTGKLVASLTDNVVRTSATIESAASVNDGNPHVAVVRFDRPNATLDLWLDGGHVGQVDVTGQMPVLSTTTNRVGQGVYNTVTGTPGNLAGALDVPTFINTALPDALCLSISGI